MNANETETPTENDDWDNVIKLVPFDVWRRKMKLSLSTAYRYRQNRAITVQNIFGKLYITREEIERFQKRAEDGEFSKPRGRPFEPAKVAEVGG